MKSAKKLFAILFLALYATYAGNAIFHGGGAVYRGAGSAFPSREGMAYQAGEAGFRRLPLRGNLLEAHARLQGMLGKTESGGLDVIATREGGFVRGRAATWSSYSVEQFAIALHRLQGALEERGLDARVIYISAHPQEGRDSTQPIRAFPLPDGEALMETALYYLRAYEVDYLDPLGRSALSTYKTDPLWTTEASFAAAQALVDKLNSQYGAGIDPGCLDTGHFKRTTYRNALLGSLGMRAGEPFTGREDFTAITPSYETSFTYTARGAEETTARGSFEETLFHSQHLEPLDPYTYSAYASYMDGGAAYHRVIVNHHKTGGPKVLFLHDGSGLPFAAFAALGFGETHLYWPELAPGDRAFDPVEYVAAHGIEYVFFLAEWDYYAMENVLRPLNDPRA